MPELPEVEALAGFLRGRKVGRVIARVDVAAISVLKTYDPPPTALAGLSVTDVRRHGKFLDLDVDGLHLIVHLARAGWLHWREQLPAARRGPARVRWRCGCISTTAPGLRPHRGGHPEEAGGVRRPRPAARSPGSPGSGPDPLAPDFTVERVRGAPRPARAPQLKGVLRDQSVHRRGRQRLQRRDPARREDVAVQARRHARRRRVRPLYAAIARRARRGRGRVRGLAAGDSRRRRRPGCGCTGARASPARCAGTPSARCPSPTPRCSTARPARPAASRSPTAGCPGCSVSGQSALRVTCRSCRDAFRAEESPSWLSM